MSDLTLNLIGGKRVNEYETKIPELIDDILIHTPNGEKLATLEALKTLMSGDKQGTLTANQLNAVNSGITADILKGLQSNVDALLKNGYQADAYDRGGYIGMKIEGGGTIYFDYKIGFAGSDVTVAAKTGSFKTYHVDPVRNIVVCDNPTDTSKLDRFYVVSDYDIGDYKHGENLMWSNGTSGTLYTSLGTATGFGTGLANTQKCIDAAKTDNVLEWSSTSYGVVWHYLEKGDWNRETDRGTKQWFVPSKDELSVLCDMQYAPKSRKSADGKTNLRLLPINFYSYYWSSSEQSATVAWNSYFYSGYAAGTGNKGGAVTTHVRLVRTF